MTPPDELAAGFSFVSILTTVFQLFGFGYTFGGPLFFWTWPVVLAGQLLVALVFAELAARYPLAGSVYQWAKQLTTEALRAAVLIRPAPSG
jgi:amino acid transporter